MSSRATLAGGFVVAAAVSLLTVGCGGNVKAGHGALGVDKALLSTEVQAQLTKKLGRPSSPVTCPEDLDVWIGSTTTCLMTTPNGTYNVTVTVTNTNWDGTGNFGVGNAIFDTKIADQPNP